MKAITASLILKNNCYIIKQFNFRMAYYYSFQNKTKMKRILDCFSETIIQILKINMSILFI